MLIDKQRSDLEEYFTRQPVDVVYLFGSQATGTAGDLSDVDIAVIFEESISTKEKFDLRLRMMGEVGSILKRDDVEIIDLERASVPLRFSAVFPRDILHLKNDSKRSVFEADTMSRYQDYKYFIKANTLRSLPSIANMQVS